MEIEYSKAGSGKTTKILEKFIHDPLGVFIVHTAREKQRIRDLISYHYEPLIKSKDLSVKDQRLLKLRFDTKMNRVVTIQDIIRKHVINSYTEPLNAYIDNVEMVLEVFLMNEGVRPVYLTLTKNEPKPNLKIFKSKEP